LLVASLEFVDHVQLPLVQEQFGMKEAALCYVLALRLIIVIQHSIIPYNLVLIIMCTIEPVGASKNNYCVEKRMRSYSSRRESLRVVTNFYHFFLFKYQ
ncbi:hypothetical protein L9F63_005463, partial [Diploptera punctata]